MLGCMYIPDDPKGYKRKYIPTGQLGAIHILPQPLEGGGGGVRQMLTIADKRGGGSAKC